MVRMVLEDKGKGRKVTCGEGHLVISHKVPGPSRHDPAAKHDVLLAEQADGAEGAVKVVVVNVGWYAVLHIIHIDDGCVWFLVLWQDAPPACKQLHRNNPHSDLTHMRLVLGQFAPPAWKHLHGRNNPHSDLTHV